MEPVNLFDLFRVKIYLGPSLANLNYGLGGYYSGLRSGYAIINLVQTFARLRAVSQIIVDFSFKIRPVISFLSLVKYVPSIFRLDPNFENFFLFYGNYLGYGRFSVLPYKFGMLTNYRFVFGSFFSNLENNKKFHPRYYKYFPQFVVSLSDKYSYLSMVKESNKLGLPNVVISDTSSLGSAIASHFIPGASSYSTNSLLARISFNSLKLAYCRKILIFSQQFFKILYKIFSSLKFRMEGYFKESVKQLKLFRISDVLNQFQFVQLLTNFFLNLKFKYSTTKYRKKIFFTKFFNLSRLYLNLKDYNQFRVIHQLYIEFKLIVNIFFSNFNSFLVSIIFIFNPTLFAQKSLNLPSNVFYRVPLFIFCEIYFNKSNIYKILSVK